MCLLLSAIPVTNAGASELFDSDTVLDLTVEGPIRAIRRDIDEPSYRPAALRYEAADGRTAALEVRVRPRGKSRRDPQTCDFPPLWLKFDKRQTSGTLFAGQRKLKLVTHCRDRSEKYQQYVLLEYLAYRMLNVVTPLSFRVRLVRVDYVDTEKSAGKRFTPHGFLIEHKLQMAARNEASLAEPARIGPHDLDPYQAMLTALFQYMIINLDWSMVAAVGGEECCHNAVLLRTRGDGAYQVVPYDFDFTGFVAPPYAEPNVRLGQRRLSQRLYRGFCAHQAALPRATATFLAAREELTSLVTSPGPLSKRSRDSALDDLDSFYAVLQDPQRLEREITSECR